MEEPNMQTQSFFPSANRRVIIGSPTKQATTGRICVPIRMPLTGESLASTQDWVSEAFDYVSKGGADATPEVEQIADLTVAFQNDKPSGKLFADPSAKVPSAELKAFCVARCGEAEEPDVELTFKLYAPFSREFWAWLGEMAGHEVYMAFPRSLGTGMAKPAEQGDLVEIAPAETAVLNEDTKPEDMPGTPEYEKRVSASLGVGKTGPRLTRVDPPQKKKSGPKELAAFHAKTVN
jgi:hypothetical protein